MKNSAMDINNPKPLIYTHKITITEEMDTRNLIAAVQNDNPKWILNEKNINNIWESKH